MSNGEENAALVRACFENASDHNWDAVAQIVAPDYVCHPEDARGPDGLRELVEGYHAAISDLKVTIDHQFTQGDHVASRYRITGTHTGDLMGTPATGRPVEFSGVTISRCEGGRIVEEWEIVDMLSLLGQIGALPEPATA